MSTHRDVGRGKLSERPSMRLDGRSSEDGSGRKMER